MKSLPSPLDDPRRPAILGGLLALALLGIPARADGPRVIDAGRLSEALGAAVKGYGDPVRMGFIVEGRGGAASGEGDATFPTASAIKTAILIELFARFAAALDQPPPGLDALLRDDCPTIAHFTPEQRAEVRRGLAGASVRRLGGIMMGSVDASNIVYNAAASVAIALLGGPGEATRAIRARDPAFAPIAVRRYMLTDRNSTGDNTATPAALAAVLRCLAHRQVPGLAGPLVEEIRRAVEAKDDPGRGRLFLKTGSLASDPLTIVRSGWLEPARGGPPVIFVVMLAAPDPGTRSREAANEALGRLGDRLADILLDAARPAGR